NNTFELNFDDAPPPYDTSQAMHDTTIAGGTTIYFFEEGEGPFKVVSKDQIEVEITGRTEEGRIFDSSFNNRSAVNQRQLVNLTPNSKRVIGPNGRPSSVPPLVEGLRKGLLGMKEGESRTIVIPPEMGYNPQYINKVGQVGKNGFDLRDQTITYDVELVSIQ
ncbi:MAG: FKBP-type peptidyl-prolyl cis-trans isomerase, partial [Balneolaceae bacterium]|nr:FKBP-type peptidyl-prolyl cis-trans isomerase [Balneolaceae bacterium]